MAALLLPDPAEVGSGLMPAHSRQHAAEEAWDGNVRILLC